MDEADINGHQEFRESVMRHAGFGADPSTRELETEEG